MNMRLIINYLKSLPVQLILSILLAFLLGEYLSSSTVSIFYTLSSAFIEFLLFVLPFMVFSFIFSAMMNIKGSQSFKLVGIIFLGVFASNAAALYVSYFCSTTVLPAIGVSYSPDFFEKFHSSIEPLFRLNLPSLLGTDKAMMIALALGLLMGIVSDANKVKIGLNRAIGKLGDIITLFLNKVFIPVLPLYVFGFCLKLSYDKALMHLFGAYGKVFLVSMVLVAAYLLFLYVLAAGGNFKTAWRNIKGMAPAGLTAFSTMSSAATMPVTLRCTEKNTNDRPFTDVIIPTTANIHMLGDDLTIVMAGMALLTMFGLPIPDIAAFSLFVAAFCVAKLSCVGIPGASILVVLPVLQNSLGFSPEMVTVMTTIYILQDSFGTAANVMGNGAFALIVHRFFKPQEVPIPEKV